MKRGMLADYFVGVAAKTLTAVEVNRHISNQHEFNGGLQLRTLLGTPDETVPYPARLIYLSDFDPEPVMDSAIMSWYDSRKHVDHRGPEWRLYFPNSQVVDCAAPGDVLIIALLQDRSLLVIIAEGGSTIANQMLWLFGIGPLEHPGISLREEVELEQDRLGFARNLILESLGIEVEVEQEPALDQMIHKFGDRFPTTKVFSAFARQQVGEVDAEHDADGTLMAWMTKEEVLFRTFEKHLVADRLQQGFESDVESFIDYSLSVQNRRKSRVGFALENHLQELFTRRGLTFSRGKVTEVKAKPDFLFPGVTQYHDPEFDCQRLTMLGAKSTCKDRWRQVLSEAKRIEYKHLLTLETAISTNQTDEMHENKLQLVVPDAIRATYSPDQQAWLMSVDGFCELVSARQKAVIN